MIQKDMLVWICIGKTHKGNIIIQSKADIIKSLNRVNCFYNTNYLVSVYGSFELLHYVSFLNKVGSLTLLVWELALVKQES